MKSVVAFVAVMVAAAIMLSGCNTSLPGQTPAGREAAEESAAALSTNVAELHPVAAAPPPGEVMVQPDKATLAGEAARQPDEVTPPDEAAQPGEAPHLDAVTVQPGQVKAIYATGWVAGIPGRVNKLIQLIEETELNAIVIDVKDDTGAISYGSGVPLAITIGASRDKIKDIHSLLALCHEKNIYTIARIVVFKDPVLATKRRDLAVLDNGGRLWRDRKGIAWVDPNQQEAWQYNIEVAKEAASLGFSEIQFDYVRFPDEKSYKALKDQTEASRVEAIVSFLKQAKEGLSSYHIPVSADVFGLTCSAQDDMGIGQKIEEVSRVVDYISPMVYPSHFAYGSYGLKDPDKRPYETVKESLSDGLGRISGCGAVMRPWLQDFSLRNEYGKGEVEAQIKAARELGIDTWMLWNPSSIYTASALSRAPDSSM